MIKLLLILFATILFSSCGSSSENFKFNNDLENIDGWFEQKQIVRGEAHSGDFSCLITPEVHYGITFRRKLADLNHGNPVKTIRVGAWVKFSQIDCKGSLIISLDEPATLKPIVFQSLNLQTQVSEPGEWTHVSNLVDVPATMDMSNLVSIYSVNDGKSNISIDDISYEIE